MNAVDRQKYRLAYLYVALAALLFAISGTASKFLFHSGIKRIRPTHASITATLEPISAGVIANIFLGEVMLPLQVVGGLIVIVSIILLQLNKPDKGKQK